MALLSRPAHRPPSTLRCSATAHHYSPMEDATRVAISTVAQFLDQQTSSSSAPGIEKVIFCTFSESDMNVYRRIVPELLPDPQKTS